MSWTKIETKDDIDQLLHAFGRFHDACLREAHIWTEHHVDEDMSMACPGNLDTHIRLLFQRQWRSPSAIELLFHQVVRFNLVPSPEGSDSIIFDATLLLQDGIFYWAEWRDWTPGSADRNAITWVAAKELLWRDASEWMGRQLRYGPTEPSCEPHEATG
jgi:hypothetical protein